LKAIKSEKSLSINTEEKEIVQENRLSRIFICKCGCEVKLQGNIDITLTKCSVCQKGKDYEKMTLF